MRSLVLIVFLATGASTIATPADAADLAGHSRLGAVFAEPVPPRRIVVVERERPVEEPIVTYAPEVYIPSLVHGYYGKPNSYYHRSYYGTRPETVFSRAPYGCGSYGYC
jgi:hypothetical protein